MAEPVGTESRYGVRGTEGGAIKHPSPHFEKPTQPTVTRRKFLQKIGWATMGATLFLMQAPDSDIFSRQEVSKFTLPEDVAPVSIENVLRILDSKVPLRENHSIPDLLNLIQSNRLQITGKTIQQTMLENFVGKGLNPNIEIKVVEGLAMIEGISGLFIHSFDHKPNTVLIEADLGPADAVHILDHELVHACWGVGEVRAYLNGLRNMTFMTGKRPELLMGGGMTSPLINLLNDFVLIGNSEAKLNSGYSNAHLATMQFLHEHETGSGEALPTEAEFLNAPWIDADEIYDTRYKEARKAGGAGYVDVLVSGTVDKVNSYLRSINPKIPNISIA